MKSNRGEQADIVERRDHDREENNLNFNFALRSMFVR